MPRVSVGGNDLGGGPVIAARKEHRFSPMLLALSVEGYMVDGVGKRRRLVIGDDLGGAPLGRLYPAHRGARAIDRLHRRLAGVVGLTPLVYVWRSLESSVLTEFRGGIISSSPHFSLDDRRTF